MIKHIFFILFFFISLTLKASADCENPPADGSVYSGCSWADNQDLSSTYLPNASLEFINALASSVEIPLSITMVKPLFLGFLGLSGMLGKLIIMYLYSCV